jgi:hypothetical protein
MLQYSHEPTIPTRVTLDVMTDSGWESHPAIIANLTRNEVWVQLDPPQVLLLPRGHKVRLVVTRAEGGVKTGESSVIARVDGAYPMLLVGRPPIWDPPSRRQHSRAWISIPASLRPDPDGPVRRARTTNLGVGGFHCVSDGPILAGAEMPVSLWLAPGESFDCRVEVVRVDDDPDDQKGGRVVLGCRFLDLDQAAQLKLASALVTLGDTLDDNCVPQVWQGAELAGETGA